MALTDEHDYISGHHQAASSSILWSEGGVRGVLRAYTMKSYQISMCALTVACGDATLCIQPRSMSCWPATVKLAAAASHLSCSQTGAMCVNFELSCSAISYPLLFL